MARLWRTDGGRPMVLNPTIELDATVHLRRRNQPAVHLDIDNAEDAELLRWLLEQSPHDEEVEPSGLMERARSAGLLVSLDEIPREAPGFEVSVSGPGADLIPAVQLEGTPDERNETFLTPVLGEELDHSLLEPDHEGIDEFGAWGSLEDARWVRDESRRSVFPLTGDEDAALLRARELNPPRRPALAEDLEQLRTALQRDHFVVLRDVVPPLLIGAMRAYLRALRREGFFELDRGQVKGMRDGIYCDVATRFVQRQLAPIVSDITGEALRPSYTWVRRYRVGADLPRHIDRAQCRWNVSVSIDTEPDRSLDDAWPIWLEVDGREVDVRLGPGDGVLYRGDLLPHWRDRLDGPGPVTMAFLHFVDRDFAGPLG